MGQKDIAEKNLVSYNDVFADITNVLVFKGRRVIKEDELADAQTAAQYKADDGVLHEQERDVAKIWKKLGIQIAFIGIENQTEAEELMPLRIIGYDGVSYKSQLLKDKAKVHAHPVITLVLHFGERRWDKPRSLHECFERDEEFELLRPFVSDYRINVFEVSYFAPELVAQFTSDFKIVADYFVQKRVNKRYKPGEEKIQHVDAVLKMLAALGHDNYFAGIDAEQLKRRSEREGGISMAGFVDRYISEVKNESFNSGMAQGMERGMAQGIERGMAQGMERGMAQGITQGMEHAMELTKWLFEQGRVDDLKRASADKAYFNALLSEASACLSFN